MQLLDTQQASVRLCMSAASDTCCSRSPSNYSHLGHRRWVPGHQNLHGVNPTLQICSTFAHRIEQHDPTVLSDASTSPEMHNTDTTDPGPCGNGDQSKLNATTASVPFCILLQQWRQAHTAQPTSSPGGPMAVIQCQHAPRGTSHELHKQCRANICCEHRHRLPDLVAFFFTCFGTFVFLRSRAASLTSFLWALRSSCVSRGCPFCSAQLVSPSEALLLPASSSDPVLLCLATRARSMVKAGLQIAPVVASAGST